MPPSQQKSENLPSHVALIVVCRNLGAFHIRDIYRFIWIRCQDDHGLSRKDNSENKTFPVYS